MFIGGDYNMQKYEIDSYRNLLKTVYNDLNNIFLETPESCCQICIYKEAYCDDCNFKYLHDDAIKQLIGDDINE